MGLLGKMGKPCLTFRISFTCVVHLILRSSDFKNDICGWIKTYSTLYIYPYFVGVNIHFEPKWIPVGHVMSNKNVPSDGPERGVDPPDSA